jgi:hypothetical protein
MPSPLLEGAYLLQAFLAAIEVLQISSLFYWGYAPYSPNIYSYMYLPSLFPSLTPLQARLTPPSVHSLGPLLALLLLFTILVQIKTPSHTRKQTLRFELLKSFIVSIFWVWLLISSIIRWHWDPYYHLATIVLSFLFVWSVYLLFSASLPRPCSICFIFPGFYTSKFELKNQTARKCNKRTAPIALTKDTAWSSTRRSGSPCARSPTQAPRCEARLSPFCRIRLSSCPCQNPKGTE